MRKFTKKHNNINWLFPNPGQFDEKKSNWYFDTYEEMAEYLFSIAHPWENTFTKSDVIDAFMKGASCAHQKMVFAAETLYNDNELLKKQVETYSATIKSLQDIIFNLTKNSQQNE